MADQEGGSDLAWFMAGLAVGVAGAILFAPRSGKETRESILDAVTRGREFAEKKRNEAADLGRDLMQRGRELAREATGEGAATPADAPLDPGDSPASSG